MRPSFFSKDMFLKSLNCIVIQFVTLIITDELSIGFSSRPSCTEQKNRLVKPRNRGRFYGGYVPDAMVFYANNYKIYALIGDGKVGKV
ncbi:hypothetical protein [Photorhabdus cinerea]|uniref:hypothetical protein n=1 Tax=Photorhabdus cinerea TaxID=471575 RepID=UPI00140D8F29|nr:hypothetical protein [Photorhabdus cinerea]